MGPPPFQKSLVPLPNVSACLSVCLLCVSLSICLSACLSAFCLYVRMYYIYIYVSVPYPAICVGCQFFDKHSEEKNRCAAGESGAVLQALPSGVQGQNPGHFWLFCILNSSKHCSLGSATRNVDESLHQKSALFSIWGFEFGITNRYASFKIALDTALCMYVCIFVCIYVSI